MISYKHIQTLLNPSNNHIISEIFKEKKYDIFVDEQDSSAVPDGWVSLPVYAKMYKKNKGTLQHWAKTKVIKAVKRKRIWYMDPSEAPPQTGMDLCPEGYIDGATVARILDVGKSCVTNWVNKNSIDFWVKIGPRFFFKKDAVLEFAKTYKRPANVKKRNSS